MGVSLGIWAEAGDTFFTRSSSKLGGVIRWGETDEDEAKRGEESWANHTGVVVESGWIGPPGPEQTSPHAGSAIVVEALWKTRRGVLDLDDLEGVRVFRPVPAYDPLELEHFRREAESYVGDTYGWWKLIGFLVKRATKGRIDPTRLYFLRDRPICSYLAAWVNQKAQSVRRILARQGTRPDAAYPFGMPPQSADPDEMMDFCLMRRSEWREVT